MNQYYSSNALGFHWWLPNGPNQVQPALLVKSNKITAWDAKAVDILLHIPIVSNALSKMAY